MADAGEMKPGARLAVRHHAVELAVHRLAEGDPDLVLLLLHGLGGRSPWRVPTCLSSWPGPVWALDFTGHGASGIAPGGGYTSEILMADVDATCAQLGPAVLVGTGLGAYVALLFAASRPELARGVVLCDGPGLAGGGADGEPYVCQSRDSDAVGPARPDPLALEELAREPRIPSYAVAAARQLCGSSRRPQPLFVDAQARPAWLSAILTAGLAEPVDIATALPLLATGSGARLGGPA
jgi:pimeloyl-ACP methyl ester carboxylesterase